MASRQTGMDCESCARAVTAEILDRLSALRQPLPTSFLLRELESRTSCRVQTIGMAFPEIQKILAANSLKAERSGTPVRIFISRENGV